MGSCCFTPNKKQFLWWHWLIMATLIGIPMLIAARYVAKNKSYDESVMRRHGKTAFLIFLGSSFLFIVFFGVLFALVAPVFYPAVSMAISYIVGVAFLKYLSDSGDSLKRQYLRGALIVLALCFWSIMVLGVWFVAIIAAYHIKLSIFHSAPNRFIDPGPDIHTVIYFPACFAEPFMFFAVLMLPGHFWARFSRFPSKKTAKKALIALVVGAFLFWGVIRYGRAINVYYYAFVRFRMPTAEEKKVLDTRYG